MTSQFSFDDVRNYLLDTGAISEAEKWVTGRTEEPRKTSKAENVPMSSEFTAETRNRSRTKDLESQREEILKSLVTKKHAGAVSLMREEEEIRNLVDLEKRLRQENIKLELEKQQVSKQIKVLKKDELANLEKLAEEDLKSLENQRLAMQIQFEKKQVEIERLKGDIRRVENEVDANTFRLEMKRPKKDEISDADDYHSQIQNLSIEHAKKLADRKAQSFAIEHELQAIHRGVWPGVSQSNTLSVHADDQQLHSKASQQVQDIVDSLATEAGLAEQQKRLELMRRAADEEHQNLHFDQIIASKTKGSGGGSYSTGQGGRGDEKSNRNLDFRPLQLDKNTSLQAYLDQWLAEDQLQTSNSSGENNSPSLPADQSHAPTNGGEILGLQSEETITKPATSVATDPITGMSPQQGLPQNRRVSQQTSTGAQRDEQPLGNEADVITRLQEEIRQLRESRATGNSQQQQQQEEQQQQQQRQYPGQLPVPQYPGAPYHFPSGYHGYPGAAQPAYPFVPNTHSAGLPPFTQQHMSMQQPPPPYFHPSAAPYPFPFPISYAPPYGYPTQSGHPPYMQPTQPHPIPYDATAIAMGYGPAGSAMGAGIQPGAGIMGTVGANGSALPARQQPLNRQQAQLQRAVELMELENSRLANKLREEEYGDVDDSSIANNGSSDPITGSGGWRRGLTKATALAGMHQPPHRQRQPAIPQRNLFLDIDPSNFHSMEYEDELAEAHVGAGGRGRLVAGVGGMAEKRLAAGRSRTSQAEKMHSEEMMLMQFEIEKLHRKRELDELKAELDKQRVVKEKEEQHAQWLADQAHELQSLKIKQAVAKEERLLSLQLGGSANSNSMVAGGAGGGSSTESGVHNMGNDGAANVQSSLQPAQPGISQHHQLIKEEAGVGCFPLPMSVIKGAIAIADGLIISKDQQRGDEFRLAMGVYDRKGRPVVRLIATEWQHWVRATGAASGGSASGGLDSAVQFVDTSLKRSANKGEIFKGMNHKEGPLDVRCLVEVQIRSNFGPQRGLGWAIMRLTSEGPVDPLQPSIAARAAAAGGAGVQAGATEDAILLKNGLWRVPIRRGLSDPLSEPSSPVEDTATGDGASRDDESRPSSDGAGTGSLGYVLLRVGDTAEKKASCSWTPLGKSLVSLASIPAVMQVYINSMDTSAADNVGAAGAAGLSGVAAAVAIRPISRVAVGGSIPPLSLPVQLPGSRVPTAPTRVASSREGGGGRQGGQGGGGGAVAPSTNRSGSSAHPAGIQAPNTLPGGEGSRPPSQLRSSRLSRPPTALTPIQELTASAGTPAAQAPTVGTDVNNDDDDDMITDTSKALGGTKAESKAPWQHGTSTGPVVERYQRGDGIDIYVDAARFLPDSCTVTRVVVKLLTAQKEVGQVFEGYPTSPLNAATMPIFNLKCECRGSAINTTTTALLRIDTIDATSLNRSGCVVGYAVVKLFSYRDRKQPKQANESNVFINTGAFQVPLFAGAVPSLDTFDENMLSTMPRLPCGSLLVRIYSAPKSADGMSVLSRDDFAEEEWPRLGLAIAAPPYSSGAYDGTLCEPDERISESLAYACKVDGTGSFGSAGAAVVGGSVLGGGSVPGTSAETIEDVLTQAIAAIPGNDLPKKPSRQQGANESHVADWMKKLLPSKDGIKTILNYKYSVPYSADAGVLVSVDSLYNMPGISSLISGSPCHIYKVIYSLVPPGLYYKDPPLSEGTHFTIMTDMDSAARAPVFKDGYAELTPSKMSEQLMVLLHVRRMLVARPTVSRGPPVIQLDPPTHSFWTVLPLACERVPGQGYRYVQSGLFQLPLIEGSPEDCPELFKHPKPFEQILDRLKNKSKDPTVSLSMSDGACVLVRVVNPFLRAILEPPLRTSEPTIPRTPAEATSLLNTTVMKTMVRAAALRTINTKPERFIYDPVKFSQESGGSRAKTVNQLLPNSSLKSEDVLKEANRIFAAQTGLPSS